MNTMSIAHKLEDKVRTNDVMISETVDFPGLLLSKPVLKGLADGGFQKPSPIQLKAIPLGRCGLDLIVQAKSGTGKTCVFTVIALESVDCTSGSLQVLVLAPTREIAQQIQGVIRVIGSAMPGLKCHTFIGGLPVLQDKILCKNCHIAVGTPGRVKQLIELGALKTSSIRLFVLDEADKLLEDNFQQSINWIYSALPENKQMLALSATYPEYLAQHLTAYMRNPTFVRLNATDPALLGIKQYHVVVPNHPMPNIVFNAKTEMVVRILSSVTFQQCLIFSNMQTRAQDLQSELQVRNWPTASIAGCLQQQERTFAMDQLKQYKCRVLISTDLTSRGIDADKVNLVINLDVPPDHETYLHRIGRAGRFGSFGAAVTIVSQGVQEKDLWRIEKLCKTYIHKIPEPLPKDLVTRPVPVRLDDVVSTQQIITRPETETNHIQQQAAQRPEGAVGSNETLKFVSCEEAETNAHKKNASPNQQLIGKAEVSVDSNSESPQIVAGTLEKTADQGEQPAETPEVALTVSCALQINSQPEVKTDAQQGNVNPGQVVEKSEVPIASIQQTVFRQNQECIEPPQVVPGSISTQTDQEAEQTVSGSEPGLLQKAVNLGQTGSELGGPQGDSCDTQQIVYHPNPGLSRQGVDIEPVIPETTEPQQALPVSDFSATAMPLSQEDNVSLCTNSNACYFVNKQMLLMVDGEAPESPDSHTPGCAKDVGTVRTNAAVLSEMKDTPHLPKALHPRMIPQEGDSVPPGNCKPTSAAKLGTNGQDNLQYPDRCAANWTATREVSQDAGSQKVESEGGWQELNGVGLYFHETGQVLYSMPSSDDAPYLRKVNGAEAQSQLEAKETTPFRYTQVGQDLVQTAEDIFYDAEPYIQKGSANSRVCDVVCSKGEAPSSREEEVPQPFPLENGCSGGEVVVEGGDTQDKSIPVSALMQCRNQTRLDMSTSYNAEAEATPSQDRQPNLSSGECVNVGTNKIGLNGKKNALRKPPLSKSDLVHPKSNTISVCKNSIQQKKSGKKQSPPELKRAYPSSSISPKGSTSPKQSGEFKATSCLNKPVTMVKPAPISNSARIAWMSFANSLAESIVAEATEHATSIETQGNVCCISSNSNTDKAKDEDQFTSVKAEGAHSSLSKAAVEIDLSSIEPQACAKEKGCDREEPVDQKVTQKRGKLRTTEPLPRDCGAGGDGPQTKQSPFLTNACLQTSDSLTDLETSNKECSKLDNRTTQSNPSSLSQMEAKPDSCVVVHLDSDNKQSDEGSASALWNPQGHNSHETIPSHGECGASVDSKSIKGSPELKLSNGEDMASLLQDSSGSGAGSDADKKKPVPGAQSTKPKAKAKRYVITNRSFALSGFLERVNWDNQSLNSLNITKDALRDLEVGDEFSEGEVEAAGQGTKSDSKKGLTDSTPPSLKTGVREQTDRDEKPDRDEHTREIRDSPNGLDARKNKISEELKNYCGVRDGTQLKSGRDDKAQYSSLDPSTGIDSHSKDCQSVGHSSDIEQSRAILISNKDNALGIESQNGTDRNEKIEGISSLSNTEKKPVNKPPKDLVCAFKPGNDMSIEASKHGLVADSKKDKEEIGYAFEVLKSEPLTHGNKSSLHKTATSDVKSFEAITNHGRQEDIIASGLVSMISSMHFFNSQSSFSDMEKKLQTFCGGSISSMAKMPSDSGSPTLPVTGRASDDSLQLQDYCKCQKKKVETFRVWFEQKRQTAEKRRKVSQEKKPSLIKDDATAKAVLDSSGQDSLYVALSQGTSSYKRALQEHVIAREGIEDGAEEETESDIIADWRKLNREATQKHEKCSRSVQGSDVGSNRREGSTALINNNAESKRENSEGKDLHAKPRDGGDGRQRELDANREECRQLDDMHAEMLRKRKLRKAARAREVANSDKTVGVQDPAQTESKAIGAQVKSQDNNTVDAQHNKTTTEVKGAIFFNQVTEKNLPKKADYKNGQTYDELQNVTEAKETHELLPQRGSWVEKHKDTQARARKENKSEDLSSKPVGDVSKKGSEIKASPTSAWHTKSGKAKQSDDRRRSCSGKDSTQNRKVVTVKEGLETSIMSDSPRKSLLVKFDSVQDELPHNCSGSSHNTRGSKTGIEARYRDEGARSKRPKESNFERHERIKTDKKTRTVKKVSEHIRADKCIKGNHKTKEVKEVKTAKSQARQFTDTLCERVMPLTKHTARTKPSKTQARLAGLEVSDGPTSSTSSSRPKPSSTTGTSDIADSDTASKARVKSCLPPSSPASKASEEGNASSEAEEKEEFSQSSHSGSASSNEDFVGGCYDYPFTAYDNHSMASYYRHYPPYPLYQAHGGYPPPFPLYPQGYWPSMTCAGGPEYHDNLPASPHFPHHRDLRGSKRYKPSPSNSAPHHRLPGQDKFYKSSHDFSSPHSAHSLGQQHYSMSGNYPASLHSQSGWPPLHPYHQYYPYYPSPPPPPPIPPSWDPEYMRWMHQLMNQYQPNTTALTPCHPYATTLTPFAYGMTAMPPYPYSLTTPSPYQPMAQAQPPSSFQALAQQKYILQMTKQSIRLAKKYGHVVGDP